MEECKNSYLFENIENISLNASVVDVRMIYGEQFAIETIEREGDIIYVSQEGNQAIIKAKVRKRFNFTGRNRSSEILIILEKGKVYDLIECNIKVSEIDIDKLNCQKFILNSDVSDGMIQNVVANEIEVSNSVGDIQLYIEVESALSVRNATGEVDITLYGDEEDYAVRYENSVGSLRVGDHINSSTLSGKGNNRVNAAKRIDLKNRVGELSLRFRKRA